MKIHNNKTSGEDRRLCARCVMDESANDIIFDMHGVCSYCKEFLLRSGNIIFQNEEDIVKSRNEFIKKIKIDGIGKKYDCIIGLSGGVDSSWVLVQAVKYGLRPLAVHLDNGWNSELAQNNIYKLVSILGVDFYTHVIDWDEYRNMMEAFFQSDVIDVELLYDNAMLAVNYQQANKYKIRYILSGTNQSTEGMRIPESWNWYKYDKAGIKNIVKNFTKIKTKTFPFFSTFDFLIYNYFYQIKWVPFLDLFIYNKNNALLHLEDNYGYKRYPYKHYESIFTRFYQGYILPKKFGIDKRKLHLSTLIMTNQLSRDQALSLLNNIPYESTSDLNEDINYFLKKMKWSEIKLNEYISRPEIKHYYYKNEKYIMTFLKSKYLFLIKKMIKKR